MDAHMEQIFGNKSVQNKITKLCRGHLDLLKKSYCKGKVENEQESVLIAFAHF